MKMTKTKLFVTTLTATFLYFALFTKNIFAQNAISFAISPPLTEITIAPGKEFKQTYLLQNNGGELILKPKVVYFETADNLGNVNLTEDKAPDWIKYSSEMFSLGFEEQKTFNLIIAPPENIEETDHNLTLVFESQQPADLLGQTSSLFTTEIGSNILVTISKDGNPKKSAEIVKFTAPKIIDSIFGSIKYEVELKNNGNSFWKPNGKININNQDSLKLAPFNILSGNQRKVSCLENEELIDCQFDKNFLFGKIVSTLEFSTDEDPQVYKKSATTIAVPFSLILFLIILLTTVKSRKILNI